MHNFIIPMKNSVVIADGTFKTNTAPLLGSFDAVAAAASDIGFDGLQLTVNKPSEVDLVALERALAKYDLVVSSIATGRGYTVDGLCLASGDLENRMGAVQRMKEHIDLGSRLGGARAVVGAIRGWTREAGSPEAYLSCLRDSLLELADYGEKKNVDIVFEANDHLETDQLLNIEDTAAYLRALGTSRVKLQIDTMHIYNENDDFYPAILRHGDILAQVDISGPARCTPSAAVKDFDYQKLMQALKQIDYQDWCVFEFEAIPNENNAKAGFDYIKGLLKQI